MQLGGYMTAPRSVTLLKTGEKIDFELDGQRLILKNLPKEIPDKNIGLSVIKMEFDEKPKFQAGSYYPHMNGGRNLAGDFVQ